MRKRTIKKQIWLDAKEDELLTVITNAIRVIPFSLLLFIPFSFVINFVFYLLYVLFMNSSTVLSNFFVFLIKYVQNMINYMW